MLGELRRLRELQLAQLRAVAERDVEGLERLIDERAAVQAGLVPLEDAGLSAADLAEAWAIIEVMTLDQEQLVAAAEAERDRVGREITGLARGRSAVSRYRPAAATRSVYVDSAG